MKINGIHNIYEAYQSQISSSVEKAKKVSEKDQVSLSNNAKDFSSIYKMLSEVPEVRTHKVEQIKEAMKSGNYNVSSEQVAEKILSQFNVKG